jgi:hypothetical protein
MRGAGPGFGTNVIHSSRDRISGRDSLHHSIGRCGCWYANVKAAAPIKAAAAEP